MPDKYVFICACENHVLYQETCDELQVRQLGREVKKFQLYSLSYKFKFPFKSDLKTVANCTESIDIV